MEKYFIFEVKETEGELHFRSEGCGFNIFEALGFIEWKKRDLIEQQLGIVKPDVVSRTRVVEGAKNTEQQVQVDSDLLVYEAQMPQKG